MGLFDLFKKTQEPAYEHCKANENEKEQVEKEIIEQEILEVITKYNNAFPDKKINLDNIFIGKAVNKPGCIGCFWKNNGWYLYYVDDRFTLMGNGPFTMNGIIVALLRSAYIPAQYSTREFDDAEYNLYLRGEKPM